MSPDFADATEADVPDAAGAGAASSTHGAAAPDDRAGLREVTPRIPLLAGPRAMLRSLWTHRSLASNFIGRDIRLKYRDSALGYVWSLLEPLMLSAVYYFLYVVLAGVPNKRHPLWIILGVITWQFFAKALNGTLTCLTKNETMIKQVYFPRELFALTTVGSQLMMAMLSLLVAIPLMLYFGIAPSLWLLMVPAALVIVALLALGSGLALACLNVVNRDVEHLMRFVTRVGVFVSPVLWTVEMAPKSKTVMLHYIMYNPMTVPITMVRDGIAGHAPALGVVPMLVSISVAILAFLFGAMIFKRYEGEVVKKL